MGFIYENFGERVKELWKLARNIDKPVDENLSWTFGLVKGKANFIDLQVHGILQATSLIANESIVPKIYCGWDTVYDFDTMKRDAEARKIQYPLYMYSCFEEYENASEEDIILQKGIFSNESKFALKSKFLDLNKSGNSIAWQSSLGSGYRAKYLGADYPMTKHFVVTDIDTLSVKPCVDYLREHIAKEENKDFFCLTNWYDKTDVSVGLCVYDSVKYRSTFWPLYNKLYWGHNRRDATFIQTVRNTFPEYQEELKMGLLDKNKISAEKFNKCGRRGNYWTEDTMFYHAWKGEYRADPEGFKTYFNEVLDGLEKKLTGGN